MFSNLCIKNIKYFKKLNSTNSYALTNLGNLKDGQVIIAEQQKEGRGRLNRKWHSDCRQNLYMSIILKPKNKLEFFSIAQNLTQYMSVILAETLDQYLAETDFQTTIKWPNDILIQDKKIAGILAESSSIGNKLNGVVLGIGINLNMNIDQLKKIDQPCTSLNLLVNEKINCQTFAKALLDSFFSNYKYFLQKGFEFIRKNYTIRCKFLGKSITIRTGASIYEGKARAICSDGTLDLLLKSGKNIRLNIGELV